MVVTTAQKAFRVLGTTSDVTECDLCGRAELKGTVVLAPLDIDGNEEGVVYYGASCGAKAAGWTTKDVRRAAKDADAAARVAYYAWSDMETSYFIRIRDAALGKDARPLLVMDWSRTPEAVAAMAAWHAANPAPRRP